MSVHSIHARDREATDAFNAHAALVKAEAVDRSLATNPQWIILRQDAYERFATAMERGKC